MRRLLRPFRRGNAILLALLVALALASSLASAQETPEDLRQQRREVQENAAELALEVDALTDDIDELTAALEALRAAVDAQQSALDAAQRRVAEAEAAEAAAEAAIESLEADIVTTRGILENTAVDAFINHQGPNSDQAVLDANPWEYARTESLIEFGAGDTAEIIDSLRALGSELEQRRDDAARLTAELDAERDEVAARVSELDAAVQREEALLDEVESRLDARLAEAQGLEALDAQLAAEIQAEEQRIAEAIAARNRSNRTVTIPDNAPVELATVRGIVVNAAIADNVEGFLAAMEARGYSLGGGGYRSSDSQVSLRRSHCGSSDYAIWEMPASQCRPPTARPGQSAHERGLAIDFTYQGSIIRSRSSAVFQVMAEVAPSYGLYNLPSEPWHWSTTGG
ncbi:MAG: D-alanyl-D-alanine carboxypeptidase family protein [Acidimicrobiales bacterium]